jgi:transposase-like protein
MSRGKQLTVEFKQEAVRNAEMSGNVAQTARELGISEKSLYSWIKQYAEPKSLDLSTATMSELTACIRQLEWAMVQKDAQIDDNSYSAR